MVKAADYIPSHPTAVGSKSHYITLQRSPAYSIRPKPEVKDKCYSPGPGAYPNPIDDAKKKLQMPKSLYPADKAFKYSMGLKGRELSKFQGPSAATYPLERDGTVKNDLVSIYPKDNANKFSIGARREQKYVPLSPGPAILPRDLDTRININSLYPPEKANKFSISRRPGEKISSVGPGPAQYPCMKGETKNKIASIYPTDTQLLPTMKLRCDINEKQRNPAPNAYPLLDPDSSPSKKPKADLTRKLIVGKRAPLYSIGIKHSPKQHILILKDDEY